MTDGKLLFYVNKRKSQFTEAADKPYLFLSKRITEILSKLFFGPTITSHFN